MGFGKLKNRLLLKKKEFYFCKEYFANIEAGGYNSVENEINE
jgi:hypothetical protein